MHRFFTILLILIFTFSLNGAATQNIVHGVKVVVIDAGHGGKFPGAHYAGILEKDLTLKMALELGRLVEENMPGVKVVYTRKTDTELGETLAADLQRRADIANKAGGDLFVSIHVNAARSTAARGVETLIMGETTKEQRYNESALFDNNREDLIDMSDEKTAAIVRAYIQNLQFTYGEYSMAMARCIQQQYKKRGRVDRGVRPQLLRVLYATDMPGVLTEIGFMSNAEEAIFLKSESGQHEIAQSLFCAVENYAAYVRGIQAADESIAAVSGTEPQPVASSEAGAKPATKETERGKASKKTPQPLEISPEQTAATTPELVDKSTPSPLYEAPRETENRVQRPITMSGYTVQVLASPDRLSSEAARFKNYKGKVKEYTADGRYCYKYCVGFCDDRDGVQALLLEVRRTFPGAFVVRCEGDKVVK